MTLPRSNGRHSNAASARLSLMGGTAIFATPQILGGIADQAGIRTACGPVLIILAFEMAAPGSGVSPGRAL